MLASLADKKGEINCVDSTVEIRGPRVKDRQREGETRVCAARIAAERKKEEGNVQKAARNLLHAARVVTSGVATRQYATAIGRNATKPSGISFFFNISFFSFFSFPAVPLVSSSLHQPRATLCTLLRCKCHVNFAILTDFSVNSTRCCHARHNVDMPRINNRMNERFNEKN